jgi:hypothetical protein
VGAFGPHDHDGAVGPNRDTLTDEAEQQAGEPAVPAGAHGKEVGPLGGADERVGGVALGQESGDLDVGWWPPTGRKWTYAVNVT